MADGHAGKPGAQADHRAAAAQAGGAHGEDRADGEARQGESRVSAVGTRPAADLGREVLRRGGRRQGPHHRGAPEGDRGPKAKGQQRPGREAVSVKC